MDLFEILIIILLIIFVISNLYFSISGRILNRKQSKIDNERMEKQMDYDSQIKVLTTRIGEIGTENVRLNDEVRNWVESYNRISIAYNDMQKERDELKRELETLKKKKSTKKEDKSKEEIINE